MGCSDRLPRPRGFAGGGGAWQAKTHRVQLLSSQRQPLALEWEGHGSVREGQKHCERRPVLDWRGRCSVRMRINAKRRCTSVQCCAAHIVGVHQEQDHVASASVAAPLATELGRTTQVPRLKAHAHFSWDGSAEAARSSERPDHAAQSGWTEQSGGGGGRSERHEVVGSGMDWARGRGGTAGAGGRGPGAAASRWQARLWEGRIRRGACAGGVVSSRRVTSSSQHS